MIRPCPSRARRSAALAGAPAGAPASIAFLVLAAVLSPPLRAQDTPDQTLEQLLKELAAERAAREALEKRVAQLEALRGGPSAEDLERQLQGLVAPGDLQQQPSRPPSSPAFHDPAIGVFMDARIDAGNFDDRLGEDTDNFRLRETEIDMRLPLAPFAEGVGIFAFENEGEGEFEALVEEGYANLSLGALFDADVATTAKLGRFRPAFGRNNQLHLHDWLQAEQPVAVRNLLGDEGVTGEGLLVHQPLAAWGGGPGAGRTLSLDLAVVNGELLAGGDSALGAAADAAGTGLDSDGSMYVARLSQYSELDELSDVEVGLSAMGPLGGGAVMTDGGDDVQATYLDADVTWRSREAEHGVGSWLVQAEALRADLDDNGAGVTGTGDEAGWWLTVQRQTSLDWYVGLLLGESDVLGSRAEDTSISPYLTWHADEFFRIRAQLEHLTRDGNGSEPDVSDANRLLLQFTWNFGVHQPHPYWVNR